MRQIGKKLYNLLTSILVLGAVVLALLLGGVRLIGFTPYAVLSGSMEPQYPVGSLIYVREVAPQEVKVDDPITFVLNEDLLVATHRVVEIDQEAEQFRTKGDANESIDSSPVHFNNLLGVPKFHIPKLGYVSSFLSTKKGMVAGGCGFVFIMLLLFFPDILRLVDDKESKKSNEALPLE